jgi:hypothetical protein
MLRSTIPGIAVSWEEKYKKRGPVRGTAERAPVDPAQFTVTRFGEALAEAIDPIVSMRTSNEKPPNTLRSARDQHNRVRRTRNRGRARQLRARRHHRPAALELGPALGFVDIPAPRSNSFHFAPATWSGLSAPCPLAIAPARLLAALGSAPRERLSCSDSAIACGCTPVRRDFFDAEIQRIKALGQIHMDVSVVAPDDFEIGGKSRSRANASRATSLVAQAATGGRRRAGTRSRVRRLEEPRGMCWTWRRARPYAAEPHELRYERPDTWPSIRTPRAWSS